MEVTRTPKFLLRVEFGKFIQFYFFTNVDFSLHFIFFLKNIRNDETRRISGLLTLWNVKSRGNEWIFLPCCRVRGTCRGLRVEGAEFSHKIQKQNRTQRKSKSKPAELRFHCCCPRQRRHSFNVVVVEFFSSPSTFCLNVFYIFLFFEKYLWTRKALTRH